MAWMHDQRHGGVSVFIELLAWTVWKFVLIMCPRFQGRFTGGIDLQTSFSISEAERRLRTAWLHTRARHPLLGISFKLKGRGGTMCEYELTLAGLRSP